MPQLHSSAGRAPLRLDSLGFCAEVRNESGARSRTASLCLQTAHPQDLHFWAGLIRLGQLLLLCMPSVFISMTGTSPLEISYTGTASML